MTARYPFTFAPPRGIDPQWTPFLLMTFGPLSLPEDIAEYRRTLPFVLPIPGCGNSVRPVFKVVIEEWIREYMESVQWSRRKGLETAQK